MLPLHIKDFVFILLLPLSFIPTYQPESFEEVTKWENFVEEHSPSILLCVGNKVDLCEAADLKSRAQFWSLDHGFEFIECVAIDSTQGSGV